MAKAKQLLDNEEPIAVNLILSPGEMVTLRTALKNHQAFMASKASEEKKLAENPQGFNPKPDGHEELAQFFLTEAATAKVIFAMLPKDESEDEAAKPEIVE